MKKFDWQKIDGFELPHLVRMDGTGGRMYMVDGKKYPSITTVLKKTADISNLMKWKKRIGHEKAAIETQRTANRGTNLHKLADSFISNSLTPDVARDNPSYGLFTQIQRHVAEHINNVAITETPLFSKRLEVAGTVDCVGDYKGVRSVIDFKTSNRKKSQDRLEEYFLQVTAYSCMFMELTGLRISQGVLIIATEDNFGCQIETCDPLKYLPKLVARIKQYNEMNL